MAAVKLLTLSFQAALSPARGRTDRPPGHFHSNPMRDSQVADQGVGGERRGLGGRGKGGPSGGDSPRDEGDSDIMAGQREIRKATAAICMVF